MKQRQKSAVDNTNCSAVNLAKKKISDSQFSMLPVFPSTSKAPLNSRRKFMNRSDKMLHNSEDTIMTPCSTIIIQPTVDGNIQVSRTQKERERNPDRLSLDKRDLTSFPILVGESKLRLLSLQHNLLAKLERTALLCLPQLVFLDIYNNQLEHMAAFECLHHLRVLLLGKNRIKTIEGLTNMTHLEVLDLHGNRITEVQNLKNQKELKVLNLAGNEIKSIGVCDLEGLQSLQEMNLRRNQIKMLQGFQDTPQLLKLFLSNNNIHSIENLWSVTKLQRLKELSLDGNPVMSSEDCVLYVISQVPSIQIFGQTRITDDIKKVAKVWQLRRKFNEHPSASLDADPFRPWTRGDDATRTRSASENRVSYLRKCNAELKLTRYDRRGGANPQPTKLLRCSLSSSSSAGRAGGGRIPAAKQTMTTYARRLSYGRDKTASVDSSCNGSETSVEYTRLPPILAFASGSGGFGDDCNVMVRNDPNTSIEANRNRGYDIRLGGGNDDDDDDDGSSSSSVDKNVGSSSTSDDGDSGGSSGEQEEEEEEVVRAVEGDGTVRPAIVSGACGIGGTALCKEKSFVEKLNEELADIRAPFNNCAKNARASKGNGRVERVKEQGGDYLVQISGRYLHVTGKNSAKHIDKAWSQEKAADVTTIKFSCVLFSSLTSVFSRIKLRFPNVEHLVFSECELNYLGQLNALADIQGFTSIEVLPERNNIVKKHWRSYAIYRLHHWGLQTINNAKITEDEVKSAREEYRGLGEMVLWLLPKTLLTPLLNKLRLEVNSDIGAKQWLFKADPALRSVICKEALQWRSAASLSQTEIASREKGKQTLIATIESGCNMVLKLRNLEKQRKPILQKVVHQTLRDQSDLEAYVKERLNNLKNT